mgnify:CR=1 FL=1
MERVSAKVGRLRRKLALRKYAAENAVMCHAGFPCPKCRGTDTGTSTSASSTGRAEFVCRTCGHVWSRPLPASEMSRRLSVLAKSL